MTKRIRAKREVYTFEENERVKDIPGSKGYAVTDSGKFVNNPSIIASVQPSWRDRTELFGYFNEFTKKFNETELLRAMYEASYNENIYAVILDEMNIARVEYYFAEMLSILEMPSRDEWVVDIIPNAWPTDPKHIKNGLAPAPLKNISRLPTPCKNTLKSKLFHSAPRFRLKE